MSTSLVIVESPAKAKTIEKYLGDGFVVTASIGHIRDLPNKVGELPENLRKEPGAEYGVLIEDGMRPVYVVPTSKKAQVKELKSLLKDADVLYLATDEDREGEAISWHLLEELKPKVPVHRMVFHEITPEAIRHAVENPRELDQRLVDAQETRRVVDRFVGYGLSPVLWRRIGRLARSAGRVQSVATRIVVERERERMAFRSASYADLVATSHQADAAKSQTLFESTLAELDGVRLVRGSDFDDNGMLKPSALGKVVVLTTGEATDLRDALEGKDLVVRSVEAKPYTRRPSPPFMTSTLQQEAGRKLGMSSGVTMSVAQSLYQNGYITYMRTDSVSLSGTAIEAARSQITEKYGAAYLPEKPRFYASKSKNAQEAHEAIRPAGDRFRTPAELAGELRFDERRLYELIWQRTIASQMVDAVGESVQVRLGAVAADGRDAEFSASGRTLTFKGFVQAYVSESAPAAKPENAEDDDADEKDSVLPVMAVGDVMTVDQLVRKEHETKPPARYTEASLVKQLEELGVGRPSTYASTIRTILDREYVWKDGSALVPHWIAFAVIRLLEDYFPSFVDYQFTAKMEADLDDIAAGDQDMTQFLEHFWLGDESAADDQDMGLERLISDRLDHIDPRTVCTLGLGKDDEGREVNVRIGRYGPYLERITDGVEETERSSIPDGLKPDELTMERAQELLLMPTDGRELGHHPDSGLMVIAKSGRFGPYVQEGDFDTDSGLKPRTASLFADMDVATVTLEDVLPLLELPRTVGADPESGETIVALNGKFGPYLRKGGDETGKGADSRSIESERQILTITLDEALEVFKQPKRRRGQGVAKPPLREMGNDPDSGKPIVVKEGRFGPYVTDGETNASLRKGDTPERLTMERARELLEERRAKGPSTKKKAPAKKKAAAKKRAPAKKKAAAKKKAPAKKAAAPAAEAEGPADDGG